MPQFLTSVDADEWESVTTFNNEESSVYSPALTGRLLDRVSLNVGGRTFETLSTTLQESHLLRGLLSGQGRWKTADGQIFVDADPDLFEDILDYLRRVCNDIPETFEQSF